MERDSKWNQLINIGEAVYLPKATIGTCINVRNCGQFNVDLANGHCVLCWDRGITTRVGRVAEEKVRKDIRIKRRKSRPTHIRAGKQTWML
jgi:hypothetical protein